MDDVIGVRPIGQVVSGVKDQTDEAWGGVTSRIGLDEAWRDGLNGLEQFSHVIVVTWLHEARSDAAACLVRRPRGLASMPEVGIFSQRAKNRPNPIGITAVRIVSVDHSGLEVSGLDAIDATPVLDLKPYYPAYDLVASASVPEWVDRLMAGYF